MVEVLVVLAIVSLLAALLLPALFTARGKAREVVCASNLRQIGMAVAMYTQDYNGYYPCAVDAIDKVTLRWGNDPEFQALIPSLPLAHEVLRPYLGAGSSAVFRCPADSGYTVFDFSGAVVNATPSSYERFGTSYLYHTQLARLRQSEMSTVDATKKLLFCDSAGKWHGTLFPLVQRYNFLFADGHVKNYSFEQAQNTLTDFPL